MPFGLVPKARASASGPGCRAVVAARLLEPGSEWRVLRALQLAIFATGFLLDDDDQMRDVLRAVPGLDADAIVDRLDSPEVLAAYEADKAEARAAAGSPAEAQGKTSTSDGPVRFTAPSIVFERDGTRLVAGGWQHVLAYDVLLANLDPTLERDAAAGDPGAAPRALLGRPDDGRGRASPRRRRRPGAGPRGRRSARSSSSSPRASPPGARWVRTRCGGKPLRHTAGSP